MNRAPLISVFFPLLFAAAGTAQTVTVFPPDHATIEGESQQSTRPLSGGVSRMQLIYSNWNQPLPHGAQITKVGFRPDASGTGTGHQLQLEVWMGHTTNLHSTVSTTFDNNYDSPPIRVVDQRIVALPTVPSVSQGPQTTYVWIPLDRPFTYDGSKNLVVEYRITANSNGNQSFTYRLDSASFYSETTTFGTACATSNQRMPAMSMQRAAAGQLLSFSLNNGPASSPGVLVIGLSNSTWQGVPLPLSLAPFGATGCSLYVSIDANVPISTSTGGSFSANVQLPNDLSLYGTWFYMQTALADLFANPGGFVTSTGAGTRIGVLPQATLLAAVGSATATTGSRANNFGLVSVFEH